MKSLEGRIVVARVAQLVSDEAEVGYRKRGQNKWTAILNIAQFAYSDVEMVSSFLGVKTRVFRSRDGAPVFRATMEGKAVVRVLEKIRPLISNEVVSAKIDCILARGPRVSGNRHPFLSCGGVRRGEAIPFAHVRRRQEAEYARLKNLINRAQNDRRKIVSSILTLGRSGQTLKQIQNVFPDGSISTIAGILSRNHVSLKAARARHSVLPKTV